MSSDSGRAGGGGDLRSGLVFVTVGTDHHPFGRLVGWIDAWLSERDPGETPRCVVQHGSASPPALAEGVEILPFERALDLTARASVVVCQAGPASVALTRRSGKKPIVVPRRREHGEHVDDHQVAFAHRLDRDRRAVLADGEAALRSALDRALADPDWLATDPAGPDDPSAAIDRFARIADPLIAEGGGAGPVLRLRERIHRARYTRLAGFRTDEYELYGLAGRRREEIAGFVSARQLHNVVRPAFNDWRYRTVLEDKWLAACLFASHGIPAARTLGFLHPRLGERPDGSPLRTGGDLESLLAAERPQAIVVKPAGGVQGRQVVVAEVLDGGSGAAVELDLAGRRTSPAELVASLPGADFHGISGHVVQERLTQHPELAEINPDAVNTLRVRTVLRSDGTVDVPRAALRLGRRGQIVDSFAGGGLSVLVADLERGTLGEGIIKRGHGGGPLVRHPDTGVRFAGQAVPFWPQVLELSRRAARMLPALRAVGWDLAVTPTGPVLIEGNADWEPVQSAGDGFLSPEVKLELAALGVDRPEADPTLAAATRRVRRRLGRVAARAVLRASGLDPRSDRWI